LKYVIPGIDTSPFGNEVIHVCNKPTLDETVIAKSGLSNRLGGFLKDGLAIGHELLQKLWNTPFRVG